jgi:hypothetical protein
MAMRDVLPDWGLINPPGIAEVLALADAPPHRGRYVLWLDELQRYLRPVDGMSAATVHRLLRAQDPIGILGTMRAADYAAYCVLPDAEVFGSPPERT